jgi:Asp-tRNA(Asn)/Glu-tRNA(Gln) amidotransferase A subunit family amidase
MDRIRVDARTGRRAILWLWRAASAAEAKPFQREEANISDVPTGYKSREITATRVVQAYLARIKAYAGRAKAQRGECPTWDR